MITIFKLQRKRLRKIPRDDVKIHFNNLLVITFPNLYLFECQRLAEKTGDHPFSLEVHDTRQVVQVNNGSLHSSLADTVSTIAENYFIINYRKLSETGT